MRVIDNKTIAGRCAVKISDDGIKPILRAMALHSENPSVQEKACGAILNLSEYGMCCLIFISLESVNLTQTTSTQTSYEDA
jgi:hypothetical protein